MLIRSERTIGFDFRQLTKLIQNFSTYILSDTKKIHIGPIIYQVGAEDPLQPRLLFKPCSGVSLQVSKSKLTLVDTTYIFRACHNFINFLYTIEDKHSHIFYRFINISKIKRVEKSSFH